MQIQREVFTINTSNEQSFVNAVNAMLAEGWQILSAHTGFINSPDYDFASSFMAIMVRYEEPEQIMEVKVYPNLNNQFDVLVFKEKLKALADANGNNHNYVKLEMQFTLLINALQTLIEEQL